MSETNRTTRAVLVGLLIGVVSFLALFGYQRALGEGPAYRWPAGDQAQHIAGAFAYLDGAWRLPLFDTDRINSPAGVNIIYTDSAPFAGLLAKSFYDLTGFRFNYLGAWFFVLWVGQAAAATYLIRQLGLRHTLFDACAALFALAAPAFLNRHFHLALSSHFLILLALGLYLRTVRAAFSLRVSSVWALLLGVSVWTHAYLFATNFAIFVAAYGDALRQHRLTTRAAAFVILVMTIWCTSLALLGGYTATGSGAIGYGTFNLDLLGYVWPHLSSIFAAPPIPLPDRGFEGFNYLGLGGVLAVVTAIIISWRRSRLITPLLKRHLILAIALTGMLAFAITNTITLGGHLLGKLPVPVEGFPFSTFRASGRFGWPLGYLAVFGALALVLQTIWARSHKAALAVALGITAMQLVDGIVLFESIHEGWPPHPKPIAEAAILGSNTVGFEPPIDCMSDLTVQSAAIEVLAIAARAGKVADSAHTARNADLDCSPRQPQELPGRLMVVAPASPAAEYYRTIMACQEESGLLLCAARRGASTTDP